MKSRSFLKLVGRAVPCPPSCAPLTKRLAKTAFPAAALLLALLAPSRAHAIAASQAWVEAYVSNYVATSAQLQATATTSKTNTTTYITMGDGVLIIEDSTDAALKVLNATSAALALGVTNGTTFVWNGAGKYINPIDTITSTKTNLVFHSVGSYETNSVIRFDGYFDVDPVLIQPSISLSITNSLTEVIQ